MKDRSKTQLRMGFKPPRRTAPQNAVPQTPDVDVQSILFAGLGLNPQIAARPAEPGDGPTGRGPSKPAAKRS